MSVRVVLILVGVLAVLIGALMLTRPNNAGSGAETGVRAIVEAPPSMIGSIEVSGPDGNRVRVGSSGSWGSWVVTWGQDGAMGGTWPVSESTRIAGCRILSTSLFQAGSGAPAGETSRVVIRDADGAALTAMDIGGQALAGLTPARLDGEESWRAIERAVAGFLRGDALLEWRSPQVMPGLDASAMRILIEPVGSPALELARVGRSWSLVQPVNARADGDMVQALLEGLIGLRAQSFVQGEEPLAQWSIRVEMAGEGAARREYVLQGGEAFGVADASLARLTEAGRETVGEARIELSEEARRLVETNAASLISRRALGVPASEIERMRAINVADGQEAWIMSRGTGGWEGGRAVFADAWAALLTANEADLVLIGEDEIETWLMLEVERFGGLDVGAFAFSFSIDDESGETFYWLGQNGVWRGYSADEQQIDLGIGFD